MNIPTPSKEKIPYKHTSIVRNVLMRIDREKVIPQSRWVARFYNYLLWCMAVSGIVIAAFSAAAIFFIFANVGWQYASITHSTFLSFLLAVIPLLWIGTIIFASLVGYWYVRHTIHGYRYPLLVIVSGIIMLSLLSGAVLFSIGLGERIEEGIGHYIPFYEPFLQQQWSWWDDVDKGLLVGKVVSIAPDLSSFVLKTNKETLHINALDLRAEDIAVLERGGIVRVVGVPLNTSTASTTQTFHACFILSWKVHGLEHSSFVSLPIASFAISTSERITHTERSNLCKGVRPYTELRTLELHDSK